MPGLFEQFPHTNLHELNLDWMIDLLNQFKQELEDRAVLSVNGMTGDVTLYESENVVLPPLTEASSWRLVRMMDGQYVGVLFQDGHIWLQQGNSTLKLLTTEDIPTSAGVVSWNGMTGVVRVTGADIPLDDSADTDSIRLAFETEHTERVNADNALQNAINTLNNNIRDSVPTTLYRPFSGADKTSSFTYTVEHTGMLYLLFIGSVRTYCGITYNGAVIGGVAMESSNDPIATTITVKVKKGDTIGVNNLTANCYVSQQSALIADGYEPI